VPGNAPYVITVGAMTDNYTPTSPADDYLDSFSSTGPTCEPMCGAHNFRLRTRSTSREWEPGAAPIDPSRIELAFNSALMKPRSHFGWAPRRLAAAGRIPPL